MSSARYLIGDTRKVLETLEPDSVDLVLSSPPFLALRSYLPADHPDKQLEIGSESTPGEFLDVLLDVVEACDRVLAPHGSLVFELGDTYAGTSRVAQPSEWVQGTHKYGDRVHKVDGWGPFADQFAGKTQGGGAGWPLDKSLCMIPQSFAWALAYGRNPFTGRETPRWRVRNVIAWCRPNPPVGQLGDKVRPATSYLTVATHARDRWFDLDAVRTPYAPITLSTHGGVGGAVKGGNQNGPTQHMDRGILTHAGAPPLDWWEIPTEPYPGSHYATWPRDLCVKPIRMMCPERVCETCGEPSRRIVGEAEYVPSESYRGGSMLADNERVGEGVNQWRGRDGVGNASVVRNAPTLGWSDCGHDAWRRGVVLDCFAGSGTTLAVATGLGRDAIGIDLDPRNADLARERCGMFLELAG